jgi:hypothetical protein
MVSKLDIAIQKVFDKELESKLKSKLVKGNLACTKYDKDIVSGGDTVKMLYGGEVTLADYDPASGVTYTPADVSTDEIKITEKPSVAFTLTDIEVAQLEGSMALEILNEKVDRAAYQFSKHVETKLATQYIKSGILYAPSASTGGLAGTGLQITSGTVEQFLIDMQVKFDEADVTDEGRYACLPPWVIGMLTGATSNDYTESGVKHRKNGFAGEYAGFKIYKDNNIYNDGTNYYPIFGIDGVSIALATQKKPKATDATRPNFFEVAKKMLMLYGYGVGRPDQLGTAKIIK